MSREPNRPYFSQPNEKPFSKFHKPMSALSQLRGSRYQNQTYQKLNAPGGLDGEAKDTEVILGYYATANFGKYKGKTFYDIANTGDYKYLKWLLKNDKFKMHPSCIDHINTSLWTEGTNSKWETVIREDDPSKMCRKYIWRTNLGSNGDAVESPAVTKLLCNSCNYYKNAEVMNEENNICQRCENK